MKEDKAVEAGLGGVTTLSRPWIVVHTQAQRERLAVEHIRNQGFETYCPLFKRRISHARSVQEVLRPLFPGYVFVALDPQREQWRPLISTVGVRAVLRNGDRPSTLNPQFIEALRAREVAGVVTQPVKPYEVGDQVRITGGAFGGLIAGVLRVDDAKRLTVLLGLLGGEVRASMPRSAIEPIQFTLDSGSGCAATGIGCSALK